MPCTDHSFSCSQLNPSPLGCCKWYLLCLWVFGVSTTTVRPYLNAASVEEWGKICHVDSDTGNTMCASVWALVCDDLCDPTYVFMSPFCLPIVFDSIHHSSMKCWLINMQDGDAVSLSMSWKPSMANCSTSLSSILLMVVMV